MILQLDGRWVFHLLVQVNQHAMQTWLCVLKSMDYPPVLEFESNWCKYCEDNKTVTSCKSLDGGKSWRETLGSNSCQCYRIRKEREVTSFLTVRYVRCSVLCLILTKCPQLTMDISQSLKPEHLLFFYTMKGRVETYYNTLLKSNLRWPGSIKL